MNVSHIAVEKPFPRSSIAPSERVHLPCPFRINLVKHLRLWVVCENVSPLNQLEIYQYSFPTTGVNRWYMSRRKCKGSPSFLLFSRSAFLSAFDVVVGSPLTFNNASLPDCSDPQLRNFSSIDDMARFHRWDE